MDSKERAKLQSYHNKLNALTFDEDLVALVLMALRPYAKQGQPVRELADFIAHRVREKGPVFEYLQREQANLVASWPRIVSGQPTPGPYVVFTEREVHDSLNAEFARHGLPFITAEASAAATVCIMSRLQRAVMSDRQGKQIAELEIKLSQESVDLVGVVRVPSNHPLSQTFSETQVLATFAVLAVENCFVGLDGDLLIPDPPGHLEIRYHDGKPEVIVQDPVERPPFVTLWNVPRSSAC